MYHKRFSSGLSLVELMISLLLGALLASGIIAVYLDSKRNFMAEEEMARIQENGRFAINLLKRELTLAGFYGGSFIVDEATPPGTFPTPDCASSNWVLDIDNPIEMINDFDPGTPSFSTTGGTTLTCLAVSEMQPDTDIVSVKRTAGEATVMNGEYTGDLTAAKQKQWYLKFENHKDDSAWVYIGDGGNFAGADVTSGSRVDFWEFKAGVYYVRNYSVDTSDGIPTLCVERLVGSGLDNECLVEGVEDMQIEFGIDTNADAVPNLYTEDPLADGFDMEDIVTARVYLLMRSLSEVPGYTNSTSYTLGQKGAQTFNDGYMRRVFSTTVQTRNAILPTIG